MTFELFFCTARPGAISVEAYEDYFSTAPNFNDDWFYHNQNTGVTFTFNYQPPDSDAGVRFPPGCNPSQLSVHLNYSRPGFFALEAMPIIEDVCRRFDLLVLDPQSAAPGETLTPRPAVAAELVRSWEAGNRRALRLFQEHGASYYPCSRRSATAWWQYQYHRDPLLAALAAQRLDVFVPTPVFLLHRSSLRVQTAFIWSGFGPTVLPPVDIVIFARAGRKGFLRKPETLHSWLPASDVRQALNGRIIPLTAGELSFDLLSPQAAPLAETILRALPASPGIEAFRRIPIEEIIED